MSETTDELYTPIVEALGRHLGGAEIPAFARAQARKIAERLARVSAEVEAGTMSQTEAETLIRMQARASVAVLATSRGMGQIDAQNAINAALEAVRAVIVKAAGTMI